MVLNFHTKLSSPSRDRNTFKSHRSQHIHISSGQGAKPRGKGSRLSAGAAVSCPYSLVPAASPCSSGLRLVLPQCSAHIIPYLCPRANRLRSFAARCRLLPISPLSVGPTMLDAALLHSSGSMQGVQSAPGSVQDAPQLITRAFFYSTP